MSSEYDFHADVKIDPDALDVEWLEQPALYMRYCELSARAKRVAAEAEQRVKVIRSELVAEARENGAKNQTEVEAYYRTHERHQTAKKDWIEKQEQADLLFNAQFAMSQRKDALENLVRLHGQGYFAAPQLGSDQLQTLAERASRHSSDARTGSVDRRRGRRSGRG